MAAVPSSMINNVLLLTSTVMISLMLATNGKSETIFNFTTFSYDLDIALKGDANILPSGVLALTDHSSPKSNTGRALYAKPITLWGSITGNVTSFETSFSFVVQDIEDIRPADGLVFFLSPGFGIPENSGGGNLGVANGNNVFVGVEFDTFSNGWDPGYPHIGMDVNSVISLNTTRWNRKSGVLVQVSIVYDSHTKTLSAISNDGSAISTISLGVDLKAVLQKEVWVGLSATTGSEAELHDIHSWSFSSNFEDESSSSSNNIATYK